MTRPLRISPKDVTVSKYKSPSECTNFQCEKKKYADFILKETEAKKLQLEKTSVTHLFRVKEDVAGYVTLAMTSLERDALPRKIRRSHRFKDIPCLLLGQMARGINYKGRGLGNIMAAWVQNKASELSRDAGCRYVVVDAELDKETRYEEYGFVALPKRRGSKTVLMYFDLGIDADAVT